MPKSKDVLFAKQKEIGNELIAVKRKLLEKGFRPAAKEETIKHVDALFNEFKQNHTNLLDQGASSSDEYINKNYFDAISKLVLEIQKLLNPINKDGESKELLQQAPSTTSTKNPVIKRFLLNVQTFKQTLNEYELEYEQSSKSELNCSKCHIESEYQVTMAAFNQISMDNLLEDGEADVTRREMTRDYYSVLKKITKQLESIESQSHHRPAAKLEDIKIPIFYGDIGEWSSFYDLFKKLVHENGKSSDAEKMFRLKSQVKGEAGKIIQHLQVTDANYKAAWDLLKERYQNRRRLFSTQVDRLLDQPTVNSDSAASVKQLLDTSNECIHALRALDIKLEDAEPIIAQIIVRKLDKDGLRYYEQNIKEPKEIQNLQDVLDFLNHQYQTLEAVGAKKQTGTVYRKEQQRPSNSFATMQPKCLYCKMQGHLTHRCRKFLNLDNFNRRSWVFKTKVCNVCLSHTTESKCTKNDLKCEDCGKRHNTLIHYNFAKEGKSHQEQRIEKSSSMMTKEESAPSVLLATAQVKVKSASGEIILLRALIDQGSQKTTISEEAAQILALPRTRTRTELHGLGSIVVGVSKSKINLEIMPRFLSNEKFYSEALVLPKLSCAHPDSSFKYDLQHWDNYTLADPLFNKADRIDIVLGGDIFPEILEEGVRKDGKLLGQCTKLGWILSGILKTSSSNKNIVTAVTTGIEKFWELEEIAESPLLDVNDVCVQRFEEDTSRSQDGKFVVRLPFQEDKTLGDSRKQAMARFFNLEKRLNGNPWLKTEYEKFMKEYVDLGHMIPAISEKKGKYYLPHQAVVRENSLTTKVRVVFDASAKTSNMRSLNDILLPGPRLQKDLFDIIIKWRLWRYVLNADIEKMYRQVKVAKDDQEFQYILWRSSDKNPVKEYKLTTVTYGTTCAPFLATMALRKVADNCQEENPIIYKVIKDDFYMDDLMTGADSIQECQVIQVQITKQLEKFGFHLRKWLSNNGDVLKIIPNIGNNEVLQIDEGESVKTLGLQWNPQHDEFSFTFSFVNQESSSKREALSCLAKVFDPLGWLSPVTVVAKLFIQKLWLMNADWDDVLSEELQKEWKEFTQHLPNLKTIKIPRWLKTTNEIKWQLHGFADASEKAYAAVVYAKVGTKVTIVAARSKVNPIRTKKTLPKLELCAAHLLTKLLQKVSDSMNRDLDVFAWSDSTITLSWIRQNKNKDKFIRTRVEEIKTLSPAATWNHVGSKENPADVASRGTTGSKLANDSLWWNGPAWLKGNENIWPKQPEINTIKVLSTTSPNISKHDKIVDLSRKCSSFSKLERVVAYILRFIDIKLKKKKPTSEYLSAKELSEAFKVIIRQQQTVDFPTEIYTLKQNKEIDGRGRIGSLNPFLDKDGILRVGGRLKNSTLPFDQKHPVLLDKSHLADLLVKNTHCMTLHGGGRIMESLLRRRFWIIGLKHVLKKCVRNCTKCIRFSQTTANQIMGDLPEYRVSESFPFTFTGVDYAGPIQIRCSKGRGQKSYKGYVAVFVCMATKAIHLEAVSDLTTESFLAALRRFFARRGKSKHMYSDNGTNFVGASRKMDAEFKNAIKNNSAVAPILESEKIEWHFIPPAAPHFGGIWEAAVKSMKNHLKRIVGDNKLTFEELITLLSQIEAVLNSRPLYTTGNSVEDVDVLTPGHFLIGRPLLELAEPIPLGASSLNRWKLLQKMKGDFWKRWKDEYLVTLQQRNKWKKSISNLTENQVVIIRDETTHPSKWPLGRVIKVHPGRDNKVRAVTLKVENGMIKRPIHKLCPLENIDKTEKIPIERANVNLTTTYIQKARVSFKEKSNQFKTAFLLLILLLMAKPHFGASFNQTTDGSIVFELASNTAIYVDTIAKMDVVTSKWNLIIYYNLNPYFEEMNGIETYIIRLEKECKLLTYFEESCRLITSSLKKRYLVLKSNNDLFLLKRKRNQRAPLEFVGSLYHILFGIMDADDREEIENDMKNIFENQENLAKVIKQQTSLIDSTANIIKKTSDEVNTNFLKMNEQLNKFYYEIVKDQNSERMALLFHIMTTQVNLMIEDCEDIQESIMNLLIDINHGRINPKLLQPSQLQREIALIKDKLPSKLTIPGRRQGNELKEVYNSIKAKGLVVGSRIAVKAEIPLLYSDAATIYKLIPLPLKRSDKLIIAKIEAEYIIFNFGLNAYFSMTQSELNMCTRSLEGHFLCMGNWPWNPAADQSCEMAAMKQSKSDKCEYKEIRTSNFWTELSSSNRWLYKIFETASINLECGNGKTIWMEIPAQGVLQLKPGCTAKYDGVTISASQQFNSREDTELGEISWARNIDAIPEHRIKPFHSVTLNNTKDIVLLKEQINDLKSHNIDLKKIKLHHVSGHFSLILLFILIIILIFIYLKSRKRKNVNIDFNVASI